MFQPYAVTSDRDLICCQIAIHEFVVHQMAGEWEMEEEQCLFNCPE